MSEPRLRELRLVGFKSFAEATRLEFGPGISAIVGPNGSGKSNLADALRWALGEQGRSLRTRKSEDVIFAGSARRHATGMADVSLVIDNADRLLPVEYGLVECGRRLFRSGENEYLLNRQKVRLRDLVDLLDSANLADNAFLFIGQGMVDQALSLRPEERRPLFEEAAGVRRHERRRRQAEDRLAEAETNLARVRDIVGELRPQARRLAAQAEQQVARRDAAVDLADGLVAAGRARWAAASGEAARVHAELTTVRTEIDDVTRDLSAAEDGVAELARGLGDRAEATRAARGALDLARSAVTDARLVIERLTELLAGLERDERRAVDERTESERRIAAARRALALPAPIADHADQAALVEVDAALASAVAEQARAEASERAEGEREASLRRARQSREAEVEDLRRRAAEAERRLAEARQARQTSTAQAAAAEGDHRAAELAVARARAAETDAETAEAASRTRAESGEVRLAAVAGRAAATAERTARIEDRLAAVEGLLAASEDDGLTGAARRRGGRRFADGLEVDPERRAAVEAALGDLLRATVVSHAVALQLRGERGIVVLDAAGAPPRTAGRWEAEPRERILSAVRAAGGGPLRDALRRDPGGHVGRLLDSVAWLPTLEEALGLRGDLPPGWRLVTEAGEVVTADGVVQLGAPDPILERRAERERLAAELARAERERTVADAERLDAETAMADTGIALEATRQRAETARGERRRLEETERAAARVAEAAAREAAWDAAQAERLEADAGRATEALAATKAAAAAADATEAAGIGEAAAATESPGADGDGAAATAWRERVRELRERREGIAATLDASERARREVEDERRRAEIALSLDEARLTTIDHDAALRAVAIQRARDELGAGQAQRARAVEAEATAGTALAALEAREGDERRDLVALEADVLRHRERLRRTDERARAAEVAEMEARLGLDNARENLLVELAALGPAGLAALVGDTGRPAAVEPTDEDTLAASLEAALDVAIEDWSSPYPVVTVPEAPSPARLGLLRRRYTELGASNPFAADEYEEVRDRLSEMEAQQADLTEAIRATRELIGELSTRITEQFLATFAALEGAFARRFEQLFAGGAASLVLTDPDELTQTGVEIMARPPGKKRQPLAMLSGGERALTAVALLFAMLEVRPVPFCVLDEVDAALDEANVVRFASALRQLAETTQFVVITHNRGTIEAADALYGVTIGDDAVSRVISLRLADATELVAVAGG
jgi:chromosome segregation protein